MKQFVDCIPLCIKGFLSIGGPLKQLCKETGYFFSYSYSCKTRYLGTVNFCFLHIRMNCVFLANEGQLFFFDKTQIEKSYSGLCFLRKFLIITEKVLLPIFAVSIYVKINPCNLPGNISDMNRYIRN